MSFEDHQAKAPASRQKIAKAPIALVMIEGVGQVLGEHHGGEDEEVLHPLVGPHRADIPRTRQSSVPLGESGKGAAAQSSRPRGRSPGGPGSARRRSAGEDGGLPAGTELTDAGEPPCSAGAGVRRAASR